MDDYEDFMPPKPTRKERMENFILRHEIAFNVAANGLIGMALATTAYFAAREGVNRAMKNNELQIRLFHETPDGEVTELPRAPQ